MKNNKLFLKIYIFLAIITAVSIIVLSILGKKTRIGYLGDFKFDEHHISRTLELNNLSYVKDQFTNADGKLDEESIKNYIFTNESITNYSYGFKVQYYSKVFRHSDIYNVYIDTNKLLNDNEFIKEIYINNGSPFGNLISSKKIDFEKIDNVNYILKIKNNLIFTLITFYILIILIYTTINNYTAFDNNINISSVNYTLNKFDYLFLIFLLLSVLLLFLFQLLIYFPGYFNSWDNIDIIIMAYNKSYWNGHPVFNQITLNFLYNLIGYSPSYFFVLNLICWYLGILLITTSLYIKYKNKFVYFLIFISFIGNIWYANSYQIKDITAVNYFWLSLSIIFFYILVPIKNKLINILTISISIIVLIISMISRHNMIVTVYPIFLLLSYMFLSRKKIVNIKTYFIEFSKLMILFALILVLIFKYQPTLWIRGSGLYENFTQHLYYLQIAGCAAISNDKNLIPNNWYKEENNFDSIKKYYLKNRTNADAFGWGRTSNIFIDGLSLKETQRIWLKAIIKHPISFIKHILNFANNMFLLNNEFKISTEKYFNFYSDRLNEHNIPQYSRYIYDMNKKIFNLLYIYLPYINLYVFIFVNIFISIIILYLIYKCKYINKISVFCISVSFSSIATSVIVVVFTPITTLRYIYPIVPITILSIISFITFIFDIGGLKKLLGVKNEDISHNTML